MTRTEQLIAAVADAAHESWKVEHRAERGDIPRPKPVDDAAWTAAHGGATECDIAALRNAELPPRWRAENDAGAKLAVDLVLTALDCGDRLDDVFVERASETLHVEWLKRNTWVKPDSEEAKPYGELTETSKNKDRLFVRHAMKAVERFATVEYQEAREAHYAEQARDALDRGKSPAEWTDAELAAAIKRREGGAA